MNYAEGKHGLAELRRQMGLLREQMRALQITVEPEVVSDYVFASADGPLRLSELFGDKPELIVIHNMGRSCPYCTMWADGYNGVFEHLASRTAFAVISPDSPDEQRAFAASRGWRFALLSHQGTRFAADMGYQAEGGGWLPGISAFRRDGDRILRVCDVESGPHDDFCAVWHLFDLLPGGAEGWRPRLGYAA